MELNPRMLGRQARQVQRLLAHDLPAADASPQHRLVEHRDYVRRAIPVENPLTVHPVRQSTLDLIGIEQSVRLEDGTGIALGLQ